LCLIDGGHCDLAKALPSLLPICGLGLRLDLCIFTPTGHPTAKMSRAAKLTLASTSCMAIGIVVFVHYAQRAEKAVSYSSTFTETPDFPPVYVYADRNILGDARRGHQRYGAAENQERADG
jgi:hypothetical protein